MKHCTTLLLAALASAILAEGVGASSGEDRVFAVRTVRPMRQTLAQTLVKTGSLSAPAEVAICAKIPGRLASTAIGGAIVEEGTRAKAGDVLAMLDEREYAIARDAAKAAVQAARAQADDATLEFERTERLRKSNVASAQDYDAAHFARDRAVAALAQAECGLAAAELNLAETAIRAPFDGVVSAKKLHQGAMLSASSEIFSFVATNPLRILFELPTTEISRIKPGKTKVLVTVDAYPDEPVELPVDAVFPSADPATRTVSVRLLLPNPDGRYIPGMFAKGAFALDERENILVVPFEAVLRVKEKQYVYAVRGGRAKLTPVETGLRHDANIEIVSGLGDDDEIVTAGLHRLADGVAVKTIEGGTPDDGEPR